MSNADFSSYFLQNSSVYLHKKNVDTKTICDIAEVLKSPVFKDAQIALMPDLEVYNGGIVGLSAKIQPENFCYMHPQLIGNDAGCGVLCVKTDLKIENIDFKKLDKFLKQGLNSSKLSKKIFQKINFDEINIVIKNIQDNDFDFIANNFATLGAGNHFIELDVDDNDNVYIVVHSGSRRLGAEITKHYNDKYKDGGNSIQYTLQYLKALKAANEFAKLNRRAIADNILHVLQGNAIEYLDCPHNYISDENILHKGTIDAHYGNRVVIPLNMRDGVVLGYGKGKEDWNYSAPHGSGRKLSRSEAKKCIPLGNYISSMEGIYTSSVKKSTLDEAPQAYNDTTETIETITDNVEIEKIIRPIYNYKAR